ncbi:MAG: hypothetical protein RIS09_1378, partial [Actinomycetota bacterium]
SIQQHLVDIVDIHYSMSVKEFQSRARDAIQEIQDSTRLPILVGGSALYIQAVLYDYEFQDTDSAIREKYQKQAEEIGAEAMFEKLREIDPEAALHIGKGDLRRIIRALEVNEISGQNFKAQLSQMEPHIKHSKIGLRTSWQTLRLRVFERVENMMERGLLDEVIRLEAEGLFDTPTASKAIGYEDAWLCSEGKITESEAVEAITNKTMTFAKKQMKWFKRDTSIVWFDAESKDLEDQVVQYVSTLG